MRKTSRFILYTFLLLSLLLSGCTGAPLELTPSPEATQPSFPADTATATLELTATLAETQAAFPAATATTAPQASETSLPQATAPQASQTSLPEASATSGGTSYPGPAASATSAATAGGTPYVPPEASSTPARTRTPTPGGAATATGAATGAFTPTPVPGTTVTPGITTTVEISATATEFVGQPIGSPQPHGSVVTIWHGWTADQAAALDRIIDNFQNTYPDVTFDVTYIPKDELRKRYEAASYYGGGPSLLLAPTDWGWAYAQSGLVADLSAYASPEFLATINPAAVNTLVLGDHLLGLPYAQQGYVLYRNLSILPQPADSFDALAANAQNAHGVGNVGAYLEREALVSSAIINGLGGSLMDAQGRPSFNSDAGLAWFGLLARYPDAGIAGMHTNRDLELFQDGKIGVIIEGTWRLSGMVNQLGAENLAIDPWPAAELGRLSGYVQTEAVFLNTNTAQENLLSALRFMGYLLDRDVQSLLGETGLIPTVLEAAPRDVHVQQAMTALEGGTAWPMVDEAVLQIYWNALDEAINNVFERAVSPTSALQSAYEVVITRLDELGGD